MHAQQLNLSVDVCDVAAGNAFHGACLAAEVSELLPPETAARIAALLKRLSQVLPVHARPLAAHLLGGLSGRALPALCVPCLSQ